MLNRSNLLRTSVICAALSAGSLNGSGHGIDTRSKPSEVLAWDELRMDHHGAWLRVRKLPNPTLATSVSSVAVEVAALQQLDELEFSAIISVRFHEKYWHDGHRVGAGRRLPANLCEVYEWAKAMGAAYGAHAAGFEIENEPDIAFVQDNPEAYMAFLKAGYLGIRHGAMMKRAETGNLKPEGLWRVLGRPGDRRWSAGMFSGDGRRSVGLRSPISDSSAPLVVMAPLALPPGPYFEQLVANGLFSYTDAFNYHYYGYAEDFFGVYRQFDQALKELSLEPEAVSHKLDPSESGIDEQGAFSLPLNAYSSAKKTLPVLLTEYGYGALGGSEADTVEGRVRQWRWFKTVGEQIRDLRIAGPMAFQLPPYLEKGTLEFGLTMRSASGKPEVGNLKPEGSENGGQKSEDSGRKSDISSPASDIRPPASALQFTAGNLTFTPADFGLEKPESWMDRIGQQFGKNEASPALAWLLSEGARKPYRPKNWTVRAPEPSPVVIDFIAGPFFVQQKRYGGYVVGVGQGLAELGSGRPRAATRNGFGEIVLYNFSATPVSGRLFVVAGRDLLADATVLERVWTLEPMARQIVPVSLAIPADRFARHELALRFVHDGQRADDGGQRSEDGALKSEDRGRNSAHRSPTSDVRPLVSLFSTFFYPDATGMKQVRLYDFHLEDGGQTSEVGDQKSEGKGQRSEIGYTSSDPRPVAVEEPRLEPAGRWRVSRSVRVEETSDRIWRFHIADFPAEPLKPAMAELPLPDDFEFPDGGMMRFSHRLVQPANTTLANGKYFEVYFRTANGNLYQVWPRQYAMGMWSGYTEMKENFTMAFYGRANLPWRFRDNRPVALVCFFRPGRDALPAIYELRDVRIVEMAAIP